MGEWYDPWLTSVNRKSKILITCGTMELGLGLVMGYSGGGGCCLSPAAADLRKNLTNSGRVGVLPAVGGCFFAKGSGEDAA
jgi:hypothetical protein